METHSRAELRLCWPTYCCCKTRYIWKVCSKYDIFGQQRHVPGPGYRCKHYANNLSWCHTNPPPSPPPPPSASNIHALINFKMTQLVHSVGRRPITITSTSTRRVGEMENKNKEPFCGVSVCVAVVACVLYNWDQFHVCSEGGRCLSLAKRMICFFRARPPIVSSSPRCRGYKYQLQTSTNLLSKHG